MKKNSSQKTAMLLGFVFIASIFIQTSKANALTPEEEKFVEQKDAMREYATQTIEKLSYDFGTIDMPQGKAWRPSGSMAEHMASQYIKEEMKSIGLSKVTTEKFPVHGYTFKGASVQIDSPENITMLAGGMGGVIGTRAKGLTAKTVYVGLGTKDDYADKDVAGKIVLLDMSTEDMNWFNFPQYEAELHKAAGIILHWTEYQEPEGSIVSFDSMARQTIPAVVVSHADFETLKTLSGTSPDTTVKINSSVEINKNATSSNVLGYIPGSTNPNELIIISSHYDKWWYGAIDNSGGVAQMLAIAKAMIDSNYKPSRTIVFIAHGSEEYGWTNTTYDWAIGSWASIKLKHPDWSGRTLAFFNIDNMSGEIDENTIFADGTPETDMFRKDLINTIDGYFESTKPWSTYYKKGATDRRLPLTDTDEFSYASAGIPVMSIFSTLDPLSEPAEYHTQMDTTDNISYDNIIMNSIANGLAVIKIDQSSVVPYSFSPWKETLEEHLDSETLESLNIDTEKLYDKMEKFDEQAKQIESMINENANPITTAKYLNKQLMQANKIIASTLATVGGYEEALYPHEQYQNDGGALNTAIDSLENNNTEEALTALLDIYGMSEGSSVSRPVYNKMVIDRRNPNRNDLFWAKGRLAIYTNAYDEYNALEEADGKEKWVLASLKRKRALTQANLNRSISRMTNAFSQATVTLNNAKWSISH